MIPKPVLLISSIFCLCAGCIVYFTSSLLTEYHIRKSMSLVSTPGLFKLLFTMTGIMGIAMGLFEIFRNCHRAGGLYIIVVSSALLALAKIGGEYVYQSLKTDIEHPERVRQLYTNTGIGMVLLGIVLLFFFLKKPHMAS